MFDKISIESFVKALGGVLISGGLLGLMIAKTIDDTCDETYTNFDQDDIIEITPTSVTTD